MKDLDFSNNWNNKLDCDCFTTLRMSDRLNIGDWVRISLKGAGKGIAKVIEKKGIAAGALNEWISRIDTGYSLRETRSIMNQMYKSRGGVNDDDILYLYLLRRPTKAEQTEFTKAEEARQQKIF